MEGYSINIDNLKTESRNLRTLDMDLLSTAELLEIMNDEDLNVIAAVKSALPQIVKAVEKVVEALKNGGRLIYIGAGTSGRIGIMDAVECVPTFSTTDEVVAVMAGGNEAFVKAVEGAEDSQALAYNDLVSLNLNNKDVICAIAASGRTPYCIGGLMYAKEIGAGRISISCNLNAELSKYSEIAIEVDAGPEVLTGSTRLKAGTCQKMICNMISTASMVGIGKVYGNLMVDMKATNLKLIERAKRIVMQSTGCDYKTAQSFLEQTGYMTKEAIVMILTGASREDAVRLLQKNNGFVRKCIYNNIM